MMLGLLVQIGSHAGEGLPGYLHRLAEANGLNGVFVTEQYKNDTAKDDRRLNELTDANAGWADVARELRTPPTRPMPLWNTRHRRFCIKCLSEKPYWRASWDLSLVTACPQHKIQLRDACQHCGARLSWKAHVVACCPACGLSLTVGTMDFAPACPHELWLSKELTQRLNGSNRHRSQHTKHLDLMNFHELAFRLGACASRPNARKPLKIANSGFLGVARPICLAAAGMLRDWPNGFSRGIDQIRNARNIASQWKLGAALGPMYHEIFERLPGPDFQFIRGALEKYIQVKWQAPLALRHRNLSSSTILKHQWLPINEISARMALNPAIVSRVVNAGEVASRSQSYKSGRVGRVVDSLGLRRIADELRAAVTAQQAADLLGLSKLRINQLIQSGFLKIWGGVPAAGSTWLISRNQIMDVIGYGADAPALARLDRCHVSVGHLLRHAINDGSMFNAFISGIANGDIKIVGVLNGSCRICDWIVDRQQIEKLLGRPTVGIDTELTVAEAAKMLAVKQEVAYALVRHGVIKSRGQRIGKRIGRFVRRQDIELFRRNYLFGSDLVEIFGKSPKSLVDFLTQRNIAAAGGPAVVGKPCRQYYWRRSKKLEALIHSKQNNHDIG